MRCSLIISTYNRPDALRLCLLSAVAQSYPPSEIIVGDDGSDSETRYVIENARTFSPIPIIHVWQEDAGFRLAKMRNKCIAVAKEEYIIQCDGDLILHRDFVKDHMMIAMRGHYLKGGRVNIGKRLTEWLCKEGQRAKLGFFTRGIEAKRMSCLHLPSLAKKIASHYRKHTEMALGCNLSFFKDDYIAVNGYDEYFEGWGGEDSDLVRRLLRYGLKKRHLKFAGIAFHLWHEDKYMYNMEKNMHHCHRPEEDQPVKCMNGIDKYLSPNGEKIITTE